MINLHDLPCQTKQNNVKGYIQKCTFKVYLCYFVQSLFPPVLQSSPHVPQCRSWPAPSRGRSRWRSTPCTRTNGQSMKLLGPWSTAQPCSWESQLAKNWRQSILEKMLWSVRISDKLGQGKRLNDWDVLRLDWDCLASCVNLQVCSGKVTNCSAREMVLLFPGVRMCTENIQC